MRRWCSYSTIHAHHPYCLIQKSNPNSWVASPENLTLHNRNMSQISSVCFFFFSYIRSSSATARSTRRFCFMM